MAGPGEIKEVHDWVAAAFAGNQTVGSEPSVKVELRRQDHSVLRFGQSCIETPIRIGSESYTHGLGTHANSEIVLHLPEGAKQFQSFAGIDNNFDTEGKRGSAQFSVEIEGREVFRSRTLKGGEAPLPVRVDLPSDTRTISLKVDSTPDGPSHDQADWADTRVVLANGKALWVGTDRIPFITGDPPFSFVYDGQPSAGLLAAWKRTVRTTTEKERVIHAVQWTDQRTGLKVEARVTAFSRYPAAEWVLYFENTGSRDTPILKDVPDARCAAENRVFQEAGCAPPDHRRCLWRGVISAR